MKFKQYFLLLFFFPLMQQELYGQDSAVSVSCERVNESDTLWLTAKLRQGSKPGSLMIVATVENRNLTDTMFYPLVEYKSDFELIVPESFENSIITIKGYFYPEIFQIRGTLNSRMISENMLVFLFARNNTIYNKIVNINAEKGFALPKLVFENKASLFFNFVNTKRKVKPDISISQFPQAKDFTDSVLYARFDFSSRLITGMQYDSLKREGKLPSNAVAVEGKGKELQQIIVTGTRKTKVEKYKEQYTTSPFQDIMEREYDCLSNDDILSYPDCLTYLISRAPGLQKGTDREGQTALFWRREQIRAYYIDEMEVDVQQIETLDVSSVALIKLLPATFVWAGRSGNTSGGVIAIYTRKGEFIRQGMNYSNWIFSVKGYTPADYILFSNSK